jgi:uncharacterized repeat protein (TIGR03803 family)
MRRLRFFATCTVVLTLAAAASLQAQKYSVLYNFGSKSGDPIEPYLPSIVAQGRDGSLYTTACCGGANNQGAVFKITPAERLTVLYSFDGMHGSGPNSGLTLGTDGNFYGTTFGGGTASYGTVFKITPRGSLTVLHNFTGGSDGANPYAPPIQSTDGNFYGTTWAGGRYGTVYQMTPSGRLTTLYQSSGTDVFAPVGPLVQGADGNFYGTSDTGGSNTCQFGCGTVFKITPSGTLTTLHSFDGTDGEYPSAGLVQDTNGTFYGTTTAGGADSSGCGGLGCGTVFKFMRGGTLTTLHSFDVTDGASPEAGLVQAPDSNFYGTTFGGGTPCCDGTIYRINSKGSFSTLYNFNGTTGSGPQVTLLQHTNGILYGDTEFGGTSTECGFGGCGVFYTLHVTGLTPFVTFLPPQSSGKVGKTVEFFGQGFKSSTTVTFYGGIAAIPKVIHGTYLTAAVPNGALTGVVTVTTSGVMLKSNKIFRVIPQITGFSPTSGPVGTVVTITGVSLKQTTRVTFHGVKATTVTVVNDTQVMATVPSGAVTGKIAITTPGGTAVSSGVFTVT